MAISLPLALVPGGGGSASPLITPQVAAIPNTPILARDLSGQFTLPGITGFSISGAPDGMSINASGVLSGTPTLPTPVASAVGFDATVTATDGVGGEETRRLRFDVDPNPYTILAPGQSQWNTHDDTDTPKSVLNAYCYDHSGQNITTVTTPIPSRHARTETGWQAQAAQAERFLERNPSKPVLIQLVADGGTGIVPEWEAPSGVTWGQMVTDVGRSDAAMTVLTGSTTLSTTIVASMGGAVADDFPDPGTAEGLMTTELGTFQTNTITEFSLPADTPMSNCTIVNTTDGTRPQLQLGIINAARKLDRYGWIDAITGTTLFDALHLDSPSMRKLGRRADFTDAILQHPTVPLAPRLELLSNAEGDVRVRLDTSDTMVTIDEGTADEDTFIHGVPFGGRIATNVTVYYTINGGPEQSTTVAYAYEGEIDLSSATPAITEGDALVIRATVTNAVGTSAFGDTVVTTVSSSTGPAYAGLVGTLKVPDTSPVGGFIPMGNLDISAAGGTAGQLLVMGIGVRDSGGSDITGVRLGGTDISFTQSDTEDGNDTAAGIAWKVLEPGDIGSAVSVEIQTASGGDVVRAGLGAGLVDDADQVVANPMTNVSDPVTNTITGINGLALRFAVFTCAGTGASAASSATPSTFVFNDFIEGSLSNSLVFAIDSVATTDRDTVITGAGAGTTNGECGVFGVVNTA